jgi:hypothetical protein
MGAGKVSEERKTKREMNVSCVCLNGGDAVLPGAPRGGGEGGRMDKGNLICFAALATGPHVPFSSLELILNLVLPFSLAIVAQTQPWLAQ